MLRVLDCDFFVLHELCQFIAADVFQHFSDLIRWLLILQDCVGANRLVELSGLAGLLGRHFIQLKHTSLVLKHFKVPVYHFLQQTEILTVGRDDADRLLNVEQVPVDNN